MIEKFQIEVAQSVIQDLRDRLRRTRWPGQIGDDDSLPVAQMRELAHHWAENFDWKVREKELNSFPHFRTRIDGEHLHFIHQRSQRKDAVPLLLLHGWPGSFVEFLEVTRLLAEDFHLVVPSLPGFGFSEIPRAGGVGTPVIADRMTELMKELGYDRYGVHGGDFGAGISTWMALRNPAPLSGIHLNYIPGSYRPFVEQPLSPEEKQFQQDATTWVERSGAYGHLHRTRPLTIAYALNDSPAGLGAWIYEKFLEWADPESSLDRDEILTNITIYWVTETIHSSVRLYRESAKTPVHLKGQLTVPCGIAHFPKEEPFPPRSWIERGYNIQHWTEMPRGGHFAAMEQPELLAADIRKFFYNNSRSRS
jgi:pimeloyl-ACP methyl ester carboxylesterase